MDRMVLKRFHEIMIDRDFFLTEAAVEGLLESGTPAARAETGRPRAVVDHVADAAGVHVRIQGIRGLDDRFVRHFRPGMTLAEEEIDLGHHHAGVHACHVRTDRNFGAIRTHLDADPPHGRIADGGHRSRLEAFAGENHRTNFVAARHFVVDFGQNGRGGMVDDRESGRELVLLPGVVEAVVQPDDALMGDRLRDGARKGFHRLTERLFRTQAVFEELAVCHLDHRPDATQEDAAFSENVRVDLRFHRGLEGVRRTYTDRPCKRNVRSATIDVLLDRERAVDTSAVYGLALLVEPANRRTHALWSHHDHVVFGRECVADVLQVLQEEPVGQTERCARLQGGEDLLVKLGLCRVGNEQDDQVRGTDHRVHFAEGAIFFGKASLASFLERRGTSLETDCHLDVGAFEGIAKILRLSGAL